MRRAGATSVHEMAITRQGEYPTQSYEEELCALKPCSSTPMEISVGTDPPRDECTPASVITRQGE